MHTRPSPVPVLAVVSTACLIGTALPATPASAGRTAPSARTLLAVTAPSARTLLGVSASSAGHAWAVGDALAGTRGRTLIEHWNGRSWKRVRSPNPPGSAQLSGVAASSARSAWAVGFYLRGGVDHTLIEHWNGRSWKRVRSPNPCGSGGSGDTLSAVAATSAKNAWAVGGFTDCLFGDPATLILHWNGRSWKRVPSPNPGLFSGTSLFGVAATSARNAWAVGYYIQDTLAHSLIEHWNGTSWTQVPAADPAGAGNVLFAAAATSARNAWAAGAAGTGTTQASQTLIEHWNGRAWKQVPSPNPGGISDQLTGVAAASAARAWAVGSYADPPSGLDRTLIERWNGRSWKKVTSPNPGSGHRADTLEGAAVSSGRAAWAVGQCSCAGSERTLIARWNGRNWRARP